nr:MAG: RNA-dependent RNA polymerase [Moss associated botourmia-like virus 28]
MTRKNASSRLQSCLNWKLLPGDRVRQGHPRTIIVSTQDSDLFQIDSTGDRRLLKRLQKKIRVLPKVEQSDYKEESDTCRSSRELLRKAKGVARHLAKRFHLKVDVSTLPQLHCGSLRSEVRRLFPRELTLVQELSFKTVQKLERGCCSFCAPRFFKKLEEWEEKRFADVDEPSSSELSQFIRAFRNNVPKGWNRHKFAYIPNGHASLTHSRCGGGTWNREEFSEICSSDLVFSSGKPRIVTKYSSFNTATLTPLHMSMNKELKRKGWILFGDPTEERVQNLNGQGPLISYDYEGATDNIKSSVTREAVKVLIEQGEGLTEDQLRCLRVVGELRLDEDLPACKVGQPMGSVMSFPLLCLINKTVVDLTLTELLQSRKISFKEWTSHRCLINGDDLLLRSPVSSSEAYCSVHERWASVVGLRVNREKTMVDTERGEINSTLFEKGELVKKENAAALYMTGETADVLGFANESCGDCASFRRVVRNNCHLLAAQAVKCPTWIPRRRKLACLSDAKIRRALLSVPDSDRPVAENLFPVSVKPCDYDLTRDEEIKVVNERVAWYQDCGRKPRKPAKHVIKLQASVLSLSQALKKPKPLSDELTLKILADRWKEKKKQELREADSVRESKLIVSDLSPINALIDEIRKYKILSGLEYGPPPGGVVFDHHADYLSVIL